MTLTAFRFFVRIVNATVQIDEDSGVLIVLLTVITVAGHRAKSSLELAGMNYENTGK